MIPPPSLSLFLSLSLSLYIYIYIYIYIVGGTSGEMVIILINGHDDRVQILAKAICISHNTNTFGKDMHQIIPSLAMGK